MEEDFAAKVMDVRVEKAKHDDDEDNTITANDANNAVATALRLMNMLWTQDAGDQTRPFAPAQTCGGAGGVTSTLKLPFSLPWEARNVLSVIIVIQA